MSTRSLRAVPGVWRSWALLACALVVAGLSLGSGCPQSEEGDLYLGSIHIIPSPDGLEAPWVLRRGWGYDAELVRTGSGETEVPDIAPGDYSVEWLPVDGYADPIPNPANDTLFEGGTLRFVGTYDPQPGLVVVNPDPDEIAAPWVLRGPHFFSESGSGDRHFYNMEHGPYTVDWGDTLGWVNPSPDPASGTLQPGGVLELHGTYTPAP